MFLRFMPVRVIAACAVLIGIFSCGSAACAADSKTSSVPQAGFSIVQAGKAQAVIVLPAKPWPVEIYAAQELAAHIEKIASIRLPIEYEGAAAASAFQNHIYIGRTRAFQEAVEKGRVTFKPWRASPLPVAASKPSGDEALDKIFGNIPPNGYTVQTVEGALFLAGRDDPGQPLNDTVQAGTLFAVYEWLENQLGVRWIWPGDLGTKLVKATTLTSGGWNTQNQPPLLSTRMRRIIGTSVFTPTEGGYTDEQRQQVRQEEAVWYRRNRFARAVNLDYGGHAFEAYWQRFNKTNPEFFNLLPDGKRRPWINERVVSMSVANPGFHKQVVDDWKKSRSADRPWINAIENDTSGLCVCEECLAWDVPDPALAGDWAGRLEKARAAFTADDRLWYQHLGSMSDRYARYYLAVQKLARESDPDATVIAYAYLNYRNPPLATKLNSHIVIGLIPEAPAPQSYLWPLNDATYAGFKQQWLGWSNSGAMLYLRPNYLLSGHEQPLLYPEQIAQYFQLAYKNNLVATDYDSLTSMWSTQGPNLYVATRLHWQPEWPLEKILDEYYGLFGPASKQVRAYFEFWQQRSKTRGQELLQETNGPLKDHTRALYLKWSYFYTVASLLFSTADFDNAEKLLAAAKSAAQGDAQAMRRVEFLAAGLKDARLTREISAIGLKPAQGINAPGTNIDAMSKAVAALDKHRAWFVATFPHGLNFDLATYNENRTWDRLIYNALAEGDNSQPLPVQWRLRWDADQRGKQEEWFKQPGEAALWSPIEVDRPWEKQAAGQLWRKKNGADYDGWAWYEVKFKVDAARRGKRLHLLFGAVDESATVYVNGREVGAHPFVNRDDWKTPFSIDVTDALKYGEENQLVVLVEDKSGQGGIWKPVWLVEHKPLTARP